jgi:hypothetical protein
MQLQDDYPTLTLSTMNRRTAANSKSAIIASLSRTKYLQQNQKRFRKKKSTHVPMELAMTRGSSDQYKKQDRMRCWAESKLVL